MKFVKSFAKSVLDFIESVQMARVAAEFARHNQFEAAKKVMEKQ